MNTRKILNTLNTHAPPLDAVIHLTGLGMGVYFFWHLSTLWTLAQQGATTWATLTGWVNEPTFISRVLVASLVFSAVSHILSIVLRAVLKLGYGTQNQGAFLWSVLVLALIGSIIVIVII